MYPTKEWHLTYMKNSQNSTNPDNPMRKCAKDVTFFLTRENTHMHAKKKKNLNIINYEESANQSYD